MTARTPTDPLRLPAPMEAEAGRLAAPEGASLNQSVAADVAEVAVLRTASTSAERRGRADWEAFDRLMAREGGEAPRPGDEVPGGVHAMMCVSSRSLNPGGRGHALSRPRARRALLLPRLR